MHGNTRVWAGVLLAGAIALAPIRADAQEVPGGVGVEHLRSVLAPHGWRVERDDDGSLLLFPKGRESSADRADSTAPSQGLTRLAALLTPHGWRVEQQDDGSVLLFPSPKSQPGPAGTESPSQPVRVAAGDLDSLASQLRERGWGVQRTNTGDLQVIPPQARIHRSMDSAAPGGDWVKLQPGGVEVTLPLTSEQDAGRLARAWLAANDLPGVAVGRIRSVMRIFVVSLVKNRAPYPLHSQLVIRKKDGWILPVR